MKEEEPAAGFSGVPRVEIVNRRARGGDDLGVVRLVLGRRVAQVAEDGASDGRRLSSNRGSRRGGTRLLSARCTSWIVSSLAGTATRSATASSDTSRHPYAYA